MRKRLLTVRHKIVVHPVMWLDAPGGPEERFSAKDIYTGVAASGGTPEEARRGVMRYYRAFPDKLHARSALGRG